MVDWNYESIPAIKGYRWDYNRNRTRVGNDGFNCSNCSGSLHKTFYQMEMGMQKTKGKMLKTLRVEEVQSFVMIQIGMEKGLV
jgi:hypothetical protein